MLRILHGPCYHAHSDNRMQHEGDVALARDTFINNRFRNLDYLLNFRYSWMNDEIDKYHLNLNGEGAKILEIGCGAGFSALYLKHKPVLTDYVENPWIELVIDAMNMNLSDNSVDIMIASHTIHHFAQPGKFFFEALRVVKPGGIVLISEANASLLMRMIMAAMRHEGWSYDVDPFDVTSTANDPSDPWSGNCAIPNLLFENVPQFENTFRDRSHFFHVVKNDLCECLLFPLSGGVTAKIRMPALPYFVLKSVERFDRLIVSLLPSFFALGRRVVLKKQALG